MSNKIFKTIILLVLAAATVLRFYDLDTLPPSPYWEEVALGYDAFSLLKTGKDHHGHSWPILAMESFGDWKPTGYFYAAIPSIALWGLSTFSIRFPSALSGVAFVLGMSLLATHLISRATQRYHLNQAGVYNRQVIFLISLIVTAFSPWAILFSRGAWEANVATAAVTWSIVFIFELKKSLTKKKRSDFLILSYTFGSVLCAAVAAYTYHATRFIAPLLFFLTWILLWFDTWKVSKNNQKILAQPIIKIGVINLLLLGLFLAPIVFQLNNPQLSQRLAETSMLNDPQFHIESQNLQNAANNTWWSKILYHPKLLLTEQIGRNILSHFSLSFLFLTGDVNPRHSVQFMGQLYHVEIISLVLGLFALLTFFGAEAVFIIFWLLLALLPASITRVAPHALRTLPALPMFIVLITWGWLELWRFLTQQKIFNQSSWLKGAIMMVVAGLYLANFTLFWRYYTNVYPAVAGNEWQYGYRELIQAVESYRQQHPTTPILITREKGRPAMYYWFYTQTDPKIVQSFSTVAQKDQGEFLSFANLTFDKTIPPTLSAPTLIAATPKQMSTWLDQHQNVSKNLLTTIYDLRQQPQWVLYEIK